MEYAIAANASEGNPGPIRAAAYSDIFALIESQALVREWNHGQSLHR